MRKLTIVILMSLGLITSASADLGVKIGFSGQVGEFDAKGSETNRTTSTTETSDTREMLYGNISIFIEKDLKFIPVPIINRLSFGFEKDQNPSMSMGSVTNQRVQQLSGANVIATRTNQASADISDFDQTYVLFNVTDWLYLKSGTTSLSVKTTESLETTGSYPNVELDGTMWGFGVHNQRDNGIFFRVEANYYDIDGVTVNNSNADSVMQVKLDGINGATAKASIGKAF